MIKFTAKNENGNKVVGLGLSGANVSKLMEGKPIHIRLEEMGIPGMEIVILYGNTEDDIVKIVTPMMDGKTIINL